jgi:hypothetical protein
VYQSEDDFFTLFSQVNMIFMKNLLHRDPFVFF